MSLKSHHNGKSHKDSRGFETILHLNDRSRKCETGDIEGILFGELSDETVEDDDITYTQKPHEIMTCRLALSSHSSDQSHPDASANSFEKAHILSTSS